MKKRAAGLKRPLVIILHIIEDIAEFGMRFDVLIVPPGSFNLLGAVSVHHLDNAWLEGQ